jgi:ferredoxin
VTRVVVDREVCMSAGVCEVTAPEVFELDDDGVLVVHEPTDLAAVEAAVRGCTTGALSITD